MGCREAFGRSFGGMGRGQPWFLLLSVYCGARSGSCGVGFVPAHGVCFCVLRLKREKGIRWMPWHREAMKDVAPCDNLREGGSDR